MSIHIFKQYARDIKKLTGINVFETKKGIARTDANAFARSILNQLYTKSVRKWTLYGVRDMYIECGKPMDHTTVLHSLNSFENYLRVPIEKQVKELKMPIREVYYRVLISDLGILRKKMIVNDKLVYLDPKQIREVESLVDSYAEKNIKEYLQEV